VRIHSGSRNNQFVVQPRGQQSRNQGNAASGHAAFDYGDEEDDGEEESDDYGGEHAIIMQR